MAVAIRPQENPNGQIPHDPYACILLFLDDLEAGGRDPSTLASYRNILDKLLSCSDGKFPDRLAVRDFLSRYRTANGKKSALKVMRSWFRFLRRHNLVDFPDPSEGIPLPKVHMKNYAPVSISEFHALCDALKADPMYQVLATILYYVGSRISETVTIRVEHISFVEDECGVIEFPHRKGGESGFAVFGPEVCAVLRPWLLGRSGWLFPHHNDASRPIGRATGHQRIVRAGTRAGILGKVNPHRLRHVMITRAVDSGWPQLALQQQVGHSNPMSTAHYYHPTRDGLLQLLRKTRSS